MTRKQALLGVINYPLPGFDFAIDKALIDAGIHGEGTYSAGDAQVIDLCAASVIMFVLTAPTSIGDNGFSISKGDREGLLNIRSLILNKYGLEDINPNEARIYGESQW